MKVGIDSITNKIVQRVEKKDKESRQEANTTGKIMKSSMGPTLK
jgi:hypothetical protein